MEDEWCTRIFMVQPRHICFMDMILGKKRTCSWSRCTPLHGLGTREANEEEAKLSARGQ